MHSACDTSVSIPSPRFEGAQSFATTHWSVVLAAGLQGTPHAAEALEKLCRAYCAEVKTET
jgi:hypothetical protein